MRNPMGCFLVFTVFSSVLLSPAPVQAQVAGDQQAVFAFDVYFDRLTSSDLAKTTGMDDPDNSMMPSFGPGPGDAEDSVKLDQLRRVYGAFSAPADLAQLQGKPNGGKPIDYNFFARIQFIDAAATDAAFADMTKESETETVGGKEYYRPPVDDKTPRNLLMHKLSSDTIEVATDDYMVLPDRNVFSTNLLQAWKKMPKAAIRVAVDLEGASHLVDEAITKSQGSVPPMAQPALLLVKKMSSVRIGLDFSGDTMLWLTLTGQDEAATNQINTTLGGFLTMAQGMGKQSLATAPPEVQAPVGEILAALNATVDGNDVNIVLPKPEGLEDAVGGLFSQMMMGGGPPMMEQNPPAIQDNPFGE